MSKLRLGLDVAATIAALSGFCLLLYVNWAKIFPATVALPSDPVELDGATLRGSPAAPLVLIEFTDYRCPFCIRVERDTLPEIAKSYAANAQLQIAVRQHPLETLHPGATKAAIAALCAGQQGKFWDMHNALFTDQSPINDAGLLAMGNRLSLDQVSFSKCLADDAVVSGQVAKDVHEAERLGLSGTPAFLVGRRDEDGRVKVVAVINGAQPAEVFRKALEKASRGSASRWTGLFAVGVATLVGAIWLGAIRARASNRSSTSRTEEVQS